MGKKNEKKGKKGLAKDLNKYFQPRIKVLTNENVHRKKKHTRTCINIDRSPKY